MGIKQVIKKYSALPVQVRAAFWFLMCSFLQRGISVITTPIFTRLISTTEYGRYNIFNSWYGIISIFVCLNLSYGVYAQGMIKFSEEREQFTASLQGLTTILVVSWTVIYLALHSFWNKLFSLPTHQMVFMMIMIWTSAVFGFWSTEQRVKYAYRRLVVITLLASVTMPVVEILLVLCMKDKVTARILGIMVVQVAAYSWMFFYQTKSGKQLFIKKFWKYALAYNLPLIPHYLSQIVLNSADRIMIGNMVGDSEAGIYSLAYSVALIMMLFNTALLQTMTPWMYQKIKDKKEKEIAAMAYITLILVGGVNLILILFAPEVIAIFAPKAYHAAIWVIPPVAMSVFFMYSYDLFAKFAFYYEKTKFVMVASVCGALLNIVLNYFCIKQFGYVAAGYTTLVCYILYSVMHYLFMKRVCREYCDRRYPYSTRIIVIISALFLTIGFIMLLTYQLPVVRYSIAIVILGLAVLKRRFLVETLKRIWALKKEAS